MGLPMLSQSFNNFENDSDVIVTTLVKCNFMFENDLNAIGICVKFSDFLEGIQAQIVVLKGKKKSSRTVTPMKSRATRINEYVGLTSIFGFLLNYTVKFEGQDTKHLSIIRSVPTFTSLIDSH